MSHDVQAADPVPQRIRVAVGLEVTTRVTVEINSDTSKTVDELRTEAMEQFDRAGGLEYRNQFRSNTAITLHAVESTVGELRTVPPIERGW